MCEKLAMLENLNELLKETQLIKDTMPFLFLINNGLITKEVYTDENIKNNFYLYHHQANLEATCL